MELSKLRFGHIIALVVLVIVVVLLVTDAIDKKLGLLIGALALARLT